MQRSIACSHATLPVVCVVTFLVWFFSSSVSVPSDGAIGAAGAFQAADYGLWRFLPSFLQGGIVGKLLGMGLCALGIYAMAELNNSQALLRISSRMLSSTLALLLASCVMPCVAQPGLVLMLLTLLSFFALFAAYQIPSPMLTLTAYLMLSVSSLFFPKSLCLVPVYWMMQGSLRALSFRCFVASLIAVLLPYWFFAGFAVSFGWLDEFLVHVQALISFSFGDYAQVTANQYASLAFSFVLFLIGTVDFIRSSYKDKTRTRVIYTAVIVHGFCVALFAILQPQHISAIQPLLLVDASIVFGHFFTLTSNRFTHILSLVLLAVNVALTLWNH